MKKAGGPKEKGAPVDEKKVEAEEVKQEEVAVPEFGFGKFEYVN